MPTVIASAKGQIVISKKEREKVGIKPGLRVVVQAVGDHIEIRPLPENPVDYFCGIFKKGPSLTIALLRDRQEGQYALSYADCFAVATAIKEKATVVTGDPEFRKVEGLVGIDWVAELSKLSIIDQFLCNFEVKCWDSNPQLTH